MPHCLPHVMRDQPPTRSTVEDLSLVVSAAVLSASTAEAPRRNGSQEHLWQYRSPDCIDSACQILLAFLVCCPSFPPSPVMVCSREWKENENTSSIIRNKF
ncbi:hypothetical protein CEXT_316591 [Caerostris extrusa]|uniref:Uncharacterized protein n=1 Tax=Caerostris extrusa TaxID=172846 RepID=A0AAV4T3G6_CAEEX|nr:hypothetical protein CEXT_316591 [Caerostris extrusa]